LSKNEKNYKKKSQEFYIEYFLTYCTVLSIKGKLTLLDETVPARFKDPGHTAQ